MSLRASSEQLAVLALVRQLALFLVPALGVVPVEVIACLEAGQKASPSYEEAEDPKAGVLLERRRDLESCLAWVEVAYRSRMVESHGVVVAFPKVS